jgi:hypothetical protein
MTIHGIYQLMIDAGDASSKLKIKNISTFKSSFLIEQET